MVGIFFLASSFSRTWERLGRSNTGLTSGQTLRIEFGVTRFDEVKANTAISGRRYPACRLVLRPAAAANLIKHIQQIATALIQAGIVTAAPRPNTKPKPDDKAQSRRLVEAARELGVDESKEGFQDVPRTLAKAKPQSQPIKKGKRA